MNLFFEESGHFKTGSVLSQAGEAYHVELPGGQRTKVRSRDVLIRYSSTDPAQLLAGAQVIAEEIDLDFLWEVAGEEEFTFDDLGAEYFGKKPEPAEAAGLLLRLHSAPMYFYKRGKGRYKAAPENALKAALASIERKKELAIIQERYVGQMVEGSFPDAMKPMAFQLLFRPDKNSMEYKALTQACAELQTTPERLMAAAGVIGSAEQLHLMRFLYEHFPRGRDFPAHEMEISIPELPLADVAAFSIDDTTTTEIDDALSVTAMSDGTFRIGIHIAAPALAMEPGDGLDTIARARMATVYMPGDKIAMLPEYFVRVFSLDEGEARPALSLYATVSQDDWQVIGTETKLERIQVENLRYPDLEEVVTEAALENNEGHYPHRDAIAVLWNFSRVLENIREAKRASFGLKPKMANQLDYNFYLDDGIVTIKARRRSSPVDKIVTEMMIFANSTLALLMHENGVPGLFRSQGVGRSHWSNRRQVRMQTHAAPHQDLGLDQYSWSTSPLRRYTDLVNQWQIIACIRHGVSAPLSAPFKPKDADLYAIASAFDTVHTAYSDFQHKMERFWCLRWLSQNDVQRAEATVIRDEIVRLDAIPLSVALQSVRTLSRGTKVVLDMIRWDEIDLSVEARLVEVLASPDDVDMDEADDEADV